ncbi:MAG: Ig-like domain-containing protein [Longimicrobiales bacterium]
MSALRLRLWVPLLGLAAACNDGSTGPQPVASVDVSPTAVTLVAGQTGMLAGIPRDASGRALVDRPVSWASQNGTTATVAPSGLVTALAQGTVTITATSDGVGGSATITVLPPPVATIDVSPAVIAILPGDTLRLSALARDGLSNILTGSPIAWLSDDVSVVTVDATGLVTGRAPGNAVLFATSGGASGSANIDVVDPSAARVLSITPSEMIEGQAATLHGVNFDAVAAANSILIDGIRATVVTATDSALSITVPSLGCRPRHVADVAVSVAGVTTRFAHPARPGSFLQVAQGQMTLLQNPAGFCLQFDEAVGDEQYLIGVQSTAPNAATVAAVLVTGDADDGTFSAIAPVAGMREAEAAAVDDARLPFSLSWRAREAELMHSEIESARTLPRTSAGPARSSPALIPGNVAVGTAVTVRYPDIESGNTCSNYVDIQGTVRYVSASGIWVSDNANPVDGYQDADYAFLGQAFETSIYPNQTSYFGIPDDADANGRVVMVVTKEVNDDGVGGIVPSANVFPQGTCAGSNEGEYFFMFTADPSGAFGLGSISTGLARSVAPSIVGHELVHNIHISRRYAAGHSFWESWQYEGQATLGEEVLGHAINGRSARQNYGWSIVRNVPTTADRAWYYDALRPLFLYYGWSPTGYDPQAPGATRRTNAPEACTWLDTPSGANAGVCAQRGLLVYGVTWSFLRWLSDHYGPGFPGGEAAMHRAWIDAAPVGLQSIEDLVGVPIQELLAHWAASLYLDDRYAGLDPLLTLPSYNLLDIENAVVPQARLLPRANGFQDFQHGVQVRAGSSAYFLVSGANRPSTAVRMRSSTGGFLDPSMQVWVVRTR